MKKEQLSHLLDMQDTPVRLENWAEKSSNKNQQSKPIKGENVVLDFSSYKCVEAM